MATRNAAQFLPEALASIMPSIGEGVSVEVLVADGSSEDQTVAIAASDPRVRIVSHSDDGIYDGMNRAFAAASGDFVLFLNSDDTLLPGALALAAQRLQQSQEAGWVSASALFGPIADNSVERQNRVPLSAEGAMFGIPAFNARLFRRELLVGLGPIRQELGLAADREFMARLVGSGRTGLPIAKPLYHYRVHEGSHTIAGDDAGRDRVYQAELKLAQMLLNDSRIDPELRRLARATGAVASLKLHLVGRSYGAVFSENSNPAALISGMWHAMRWRGHLSGY